MHSSWHLRHLPVPSSSLRKRCFVAETSSPEYLYGSMKVLLNDSPLPLPHFGGSSSALALQHILHGKAVHGIESHRVHVLAAGAGPRGPLRMEKLSEKSGSPNTSQDATLGLKIPTASAMGNHKAAFCATSLWSHTHPMGILPSSCVSVVYNGCLADDLFLYSRKRCSGVFSSSRPFSTGAAILGLGQPFCAEPGSVIAAGRVASPLYTLCKMLF